MATDCRFMKDKYTPAILSIPGKITILLGTVALLAAGIYGVTQVKHYMRARIISTITEFVVRDKPEHHVSLTAVGYYTV